MNAKEYRVQRDEALRKLEAIGEILRSRRGMTQYLTPEQLLEQIEAVFTEKVN